MSKSVLEIGGLANQLSIKNQVRILGIIDALLYSQNAPAKPISNPRASPPAYYIIVGTKDKHVIIAKDGGLIPDKLREEGANELMSICEDLIRWYDNTTG